MRLCETLLFALALLASSVLADHHEEGHACEIDNPAVSDDGKFLIVFREVSTCFKNVISQEDAAQLKAPAPETTNLVKFQDFFKKFCTHDEAVRTCLTGVHEHFAHCKNKRISMEIQIVTEIVQHLVYTGCEHDGDRLAHLADMMLYFFVKTETVPPSVRCMQHAFTMLGFTEKTDLDAISDTYFLYKELPKFQKCKEYIEGDGNKEVYQWVLDEFTHKLRCQHPEEDHLTLCSEIDVSKSRRTYTPTWKIIYLTPVTKRTSPTTNTRQVPTTRTLNSSGKSTADSARTSSCPRVWSRPTPTARSA